MNKKMADVDIAPFGEHESRPEEPMDEHIPLDQGRSTWKPEHEQETSFRVQVIQVERVYFIKNI